MRTTLQQLAALGQTPWIHHLSRDWIHDDRHGLPRLIRCGITGVVADPASLAAALAHTTAYDDQIRTLSPLMDDSERVRRQLVRADAQQACDLLLETVVADKPMDGWVAVDIDPRRTADAAAAVDQAQWLAEAIGRPNLLIGIPAAGGGLTAIQEATARGLSVMATGVHSPGRYRQTAIAYRRGLARLVAAGGDPGAVTSVASVPIATLDEKADLRLRAMGRRPDLAGTFGVATAALIRAEYLAFFTGEAWEPLAALGATPQRCLWSGLTVPDARQPESRYVESLITRGSVALLSPYTADAFLAGGHARPMADAQIPAARRTLAALVKAGISPLVIAGLLEAEAVRRGAEAFEGVRALIAEKRALLGVGVGR